jgi:nucleosome binding factor SPN SPT16 subunit
MVPFHVSMIKNASKSSDEFLRINFAAPLGITQTPGEGAATQQPAEGGKVYIKELTYRIPDIRSLNNSLRLIKELRKRVQATESERREKIDLIPVEPKRSEMLSSGITPFFSLFSKRILFCRKDEILD